MVWTDASSCERLFSLADQCVAAVRHNNEAQSEQSHVPFKQLLENRVGLQKESDLNLIHLQSERSLQELYNHHKVILKWAKLVAYTK